MNDYYKILTEKEGEKIEYLFESGYDIKQISEKLLFTENAIVDTLIYRGALISG